MILPAKEDGNDLAKDNSRKVYNVNPLDSFPDCSKTGDNQRLQKILVLCCCHARRHDNRGLVHEFVAGEAYGMSIERKGNEIKARPRLLG